MFHGFIFPLEYQDNNTLESGRKPYLEKASAIWMQSDDIILAPLVVLGAVLSSCTPTPPHLIPAPFPKTLLVFLLLMEPSKQKQNTPTPS